MKGIVFTEFLEMVEDRFGLEIADSVIESSRLESGGAYTAVGTYDHRELLQLVTQLSRITGTATPDLVRAFGQHLFGRFVSAYPQFFTGVASAFDFLNGIEGYIHVEVRKLYPDAELPRFMCRRLAPERMEMTYRSSRPFADFAEGLIRGCAEHFGQPMRIERQDLSHGAEHAARFTLTSVASVPTCTIPSC